MQHLVQRLEQGSLDVIGDIHGEREALSSDPPLCARLGCY